MRIAGCLTVFFLIGVLAAQSFLDQQKQYPRVRESITEKLDTIKSLYISKQLDFPPEQIFIRIFKLEKKLELWAKSTEVDTFSLVKTYPFCSSSGTLGPKRRQGDLQIPEGFYVIDRFNPFSRFYLSLGINYPNASDKILSDQDKPGGDIFIHGDCVTIGCVPVTDDGIKEIYITAVLARENGHNEIPVHIFPFRLTEDNLDRMNRIYRMRHRDFWKTLQTAYSYFESYKKLPDISVNRSTGVYIIK